METHDLLAKHAALAYDEVRQAIDGVDEGLAWAKVICAPDEYLHTEGSIISSVLHMAGCKILYGSMAYRDLEIRWRDIVERFESFWPSWEATRAYMDEAHAYWIASWQQERDFERLVRRFDNQEWPSWKIIGTVTQHDTYHAGQIQMLRSILTPTDAPPPSEAADWRLHCQPLPSW